MRTIQANEFSLIAGGNLIEAIAAFPLACVTVFTGSTAALITAPLAAAHCGNSLTDGIYKGLSHATAGLQAAYQIEKNYYYGESSFDLLQNIFNPFTGQCGAGY